MNAERIDGGRIVVASEFLAVLRNHGLDSFERVMAARDGKIVRDFPGRRTVRLELKTNHGSVLAIYLKRYEAGYLSPARRLLRKLRWPGAADEAGQEWEMIQQVGSVGIRTATPLALGQDRLGALVTRSFLMTVEIAGAVPAQTFVAQLSPLDRRSFLRRIAQVVRRFHQAGFVHKDLYLGHILVVPNASEPELFLIDLQRVISPCCLRTRWLAKDLGALAYSSLKADVSRTDLLRAFKTYCDTSNLDGAGKRMARRVNRRVAWLRTRWPKHDADFEQLE